MSALPPNAFRGADKRGSPRRGHVESYFLRANDPARPRALWIKATVLFPLDGPPLCESWFIFFDGERNRSFAHRTTAPYRAAFARVEGSATEVQAPGTHLTLAAQGRARGAMDGADGHARWDLAWTRADGALGAPLSILPSRLLLEGPFPRSKLLSPFPVLSFGGALEVFGERVQVDSWTGMEGHNWGREHAYEYAWGQCHFLGETGRPGAWAEGFTARVKVGPMKTPRLSALVVQRGEESFRFDRLFEPSKQRAVLGDRSWTIAIEGDVGRAELSMDASVMPMVCLGYRNPSGVLSYCLNSKLARTRLVVEPARGASFSLESPHGGALEFLRREPPAGRIPGIARIV